MTRKGMPTRKPNSEYRTREHLLEREVEALIKAAKGNRHGLRDSTIILMMWRHGLRVSELCSLQWTDVDFEDATLNVRRAKGGEHGTHPIADNEIAALRAHPATSAVASLGFMTAVWVMQICQAR